MNKSLKIILGTIFTIIIFCLGIGIGYYINNDDDKFDREEQYETDDNDENDEETKDEILSLSLSEIKSEILEIDDLSYYLYNGRTSLPKNENLFTDNLKSYITIQYYDIDTTTDTSIDTDSPYIYANKEEYIKAYKELWGTTPNYEKELNGKVTTYHSGGPGLYVPFTFEVEQITKENDIYDVKIIVDEYEIKDNNELIKSSQNESHLKFKIVNDELQLISYIISK